MASFITPGAVFENRKNGTITKILMVTNESISAELKSTYPPQIVFVTESGKILSQTEEQFLKTRQYVEIDQTIKPWLEMLFNDEPDEDEDEIQIDTRPSIVVNEEPVDAVTSSDNDVLFVEKSELTINWGPHPKSTELNKCLLSFDSYPTIEGDKVKIVYVLSFKPSVDLTQQDIENCFGNYSDNVIGAFEVNHLTGGKKKIDYDIFMGVYEKFTKQGVIYNVYFSSESDLCLGGGDENNLSVQ